MLKGTQTLQTVRVLLPTMESTVVERNHHSTTTIYPYVAISEAVFPLLLII